MIVVAGLPAALDAFEFLASAAGEVPRSCVIIEGMSD